MTQLRSLNINDLRPGDQVFVKNTLVTILAKLDDRTLLCPDGETVDISAIDSVYKVNFDRLLVETGAYRELQNAGMVSSKIADLVVGDVVFVFSGPVATMSTIAMIDRPRGYVFNQNGDILPWGRDEMVMTGWRVDNKNGLLTETGLTTVQQSYE